MEIHEQLKRQLKEYKWKDYTKVSVEIAPEYDDFFEKAGDDYIKSMGWNMYMTPEQAARGLELFERIKDDNPDQESSGTCKDLSQFECYN